MSTGNKGNSRPTTAFNAQSQQQKSQSIIGGHLKNAGSNKIKNNLYQVQEAYEKKKTEMTLNQDIAKAKFNKGISQASPELGGSKNRRPTEKEKEKFKASQEAARKGFEERWKQKASLAAEGKEWRDEQLKKQKAEQRKQITAKFNEPQRGKAAAQSRSAVKPEAKQQSSPSTDKQKRIEGIKDNLKKQSQQSNTSRTFNRAAKKR
ncbi:MAG: hypothetical protein AAFZ15_24895 [Bacteroidota bacterium]